MCFTDPEVVVAGQSPVEVAKVGLDCITAQFPFAANGRAPATASSAGSRWGTRCTFSAGVCAYGSWLAGPLLMPIRVQVMPRLAKVNSEIGARPSCNMRCALLF